MFIKFLIEFFINKIQICQYRSDISLLIFSFVDEFYKISYAERKVEKKVSTLKFDLNEANSTEVDVKIRKLKISYNRK
jgi:hypothetical protein